ncbi:MAG: OmpA family protein [Pseudomonadota bacterium]
MKSPFICAISLVAVLSACAPTTGPNPNENRDSLAVAGALVGGTIGAIVGDDGGSAAIGAVIGAGIGAGIGTELDKQAADLRNDIGNSQVTVTNTGDSLLVNFPQDILFAFDSAAVSVTNKRELNALATNLQQYPNTVVEVIGHTDSVGSASYNFDLSARRAGSVAGVLVDGGVSGSRVTATGRGESQPVADNVTDAGRAQNRRVEVVIRPVT